MSGAFLGHVKSTIQLDGVPTRGQVGSNAVVVPVVVNAIYDKCKTLAGSDSIDHTDDFDNGRTLLGMFPVGNWRNCGQLLMLLVVQTNGPAPALELTFDLEHSDSAMDFPRVNYRYAGEFMARITSAIEGALVPHRSPERMKG